MAAALSLAAFASAGIAKAADLPVKAKKAADLPFFLVIDDRVTFSWIPKGTDPGVFSVKPGGGINADTAKQVYSFTHFDAWAYGTNFFTISMFKSDHNDPANPCTNAGVVFNPGTGVATAANCEGATEIYGLFRSTFGFNELFNTKSFTYGPLHNVSFEVGMDANTENNYLSPAKRDVVAGLQFAFDLPYKGYINVAPLMYLRVRQPQRLHPVRRRLRRPDSRRELSSSTATEASSRPGRSKSTTTWIWASCRRACSSGRSAVARLGMARRARRTIRCRSTPSPTSTPPSSSTPSRSV